MKKIIFIALLIILGGGGLYLKAGFNSSADMAFEGIKASVLSNEEKIDNASTIIKASIIPFDMRPVGDCMKDEECYFYTFSVNINAENKNRVIYDAETSDVEVESGLWTSLTLTPEGEEPTKKKIRVVNALTPSQCIEDKECAWFAFYNLVAQTAKGQKADGKLRKWNKSIEYSVMPKDVEGYKKYELEAVNALNTIQPFFPYEIKPNKVLTYLIWFSPDIRKDVLSKYNNYFLKAFGDNDVIPSIIKNSLKGDEIKCQSLPIYNIDTFYYDGGLSFMDISDRWRSYCLNKSIMVNVGFSTYLKSFPFSIQNQITNKSKAQKLTGLDKFLITLLYQVEFKAGMKTSVEVLRPAFEQAYPKSLKQYNDIKTGEKHG